MTCKNNAFLDSKQVKNILGLTCEKPYDEEAGKKLVDELLGKFHQENVVRWKNVNGEMVMSYGIEVWTITEVLPYHGIAIVKHNGRFMSLRIEDLRL